MQREKTSLASFKHRARLKNAHLAKNTNQQYQADKKEPFKDKTLSLNSIKYNIFRLQSSPTGPAEHCAGGSRPRSCNSWNMTTKITNQFENFEE